MTLLYRLFFISCLLWLAHPVSAQIKPDVDSLLVQAQKLARAGQYAESRVLCRQVLQTAPAYTDAAILLGYTFAWQQQYDSARLALEQPTAIDKNRSDYLLARARIELWDSSPTTALHYSQQGLLQDSLSTELLLIQAQSLEKLQRIEAAQAVYVRILHVAPQHLQAQKALQNLSLKWSSHLKLDYQLTSFKPAFSDRQLAAVEYGLMRPKGTYLARAQYVRQHGLNSFQLEADAYPSLGKKNYLLLNAGISNGRLHPGYRFGAEIFQALPHQFEISAGLRTLFYEEEEVILYTGQLAAYIKKNWLSLRPYLHQNASGWNATLILQARHYFATRNEYVSLLVSRGSIPSVQLGTQEINRLGASLVGANACFRIGENMFLGANLAYEYEEISREIFRNRYTLGLSLLSTIK
jgi:YaiO family outer membrane protein